MLQNRNIKITHVSGGCANGLMDDASCILYFYPDQKIPEVGETVELAVSCISVKDGFREFDVKDYMI